MIYMTCPQEFYMEFGRFVFCSFGSGVQQRMEMDWFIPPLPFGSSSGQRSKLDLRVSPCCPAGCKKAADMGGGKGKGRKDYRHDIGEMGYVMTGCLSSWKAWPLRLHR